MVAATMGSQNGSPCSTPQRVSPEPLTNMKLVFETDWGIKFYCVNCLGLIFWREGSISPSSFHTNTALTLTQTLKELL